MVHLCSPLWLLELVLSLNFVTFTVATFFKSIEAIRQQITLCKLFLLLNHTVVYVVVTCIHKMTYEFHWPLSLNLVPQDIVTLTCLVIYTKHLRYKIDSL